jgi:hypothetical protein
MKRILLLGILLALELGAGWQHEASAQDPLPSWNDTPPKRALLSFIERATKAGTPDQIPPAERIVVFDNDGTLWTEQPIYIQFAFALDRVKTLAPKHPEWKKKDPFPKLLTTPKEETVPVSEKELMEILMATHAGMTTEEFARIAGDWLATAKHPRFDRPYIECVYQPMLELLACLRANGFKTYLVSGGGTEFMRVFSEKVYGIPPEQVIGSAIKTQFVLSGGQPVLMRMPEVDFIDDKAGKPVAIHNFIGRRPVLAFGNSDGDLQMLQWTAAGSGMRFMGLVHHTDATREYAYDRTSRIGRLDLALDEAVAKNWTVVDMKRDWKIVFAFEKP